MPVDPWAQFAVPAPQNGGADKWAAYAQPAAASAAPPPPPPTPQPGFFENLGKSLGISKEAADAHQQEFEEHPIASLLKAVGGPAYQAASGLIGGIWRSGGESYDAGQSLAQGNPAQAAVHAITAIPILGPALKTMSEQAPSTTPGQSYMGQVASAATPGNVGTGLGAAAQIAPLALGGLDAVAPGRSVIPNPSLPSALAPDADAAALRGLQIGPKSPKALSTLSAVDNARPFLQGAQDLSDLQSKIAPAKAEIWKPYQQALDAIGNRPVQGPDGMTTVSDLESQRLQLSALNRGLKSNLPEAIQLAQQKGMTAAQLLDQERAVKAALDPELESTGINPQLIRKVFGSVAQIGQRVSGKTTLIEPTQPSGLGKIANLSIKQPLQAPAQIASGLRDLLAGRPLYAAKPTDLGVREGFANAGPKPDFGTPAPQFSQPPLQLGQGPTVLPEQPLQNAPPSGPAINIAPDTRAARLGLLLKAPPIELPGAVAETPPPPSYAGTAASRLGRLLSSSTDEQNIPLSEKVDIFPNQLPGAKRVGSGISPRLAEILKRTGR